MGKPIGKTSVNQRGKHRGKKHMLTQAYDFDKNGNLINFDPTRKVVAFPETQEQKELYRKAAEIPEKPKLNPADIKLDYSRDALLTDFGKATLDDRYLLEGETYQAMFARVACAYADNTEHAQRL
jgi:ribonucleoside-diphosphate reductase alpha chain